MTAGGVYTETLTDVVAGISTADDRQTYIETASVLIQAGVSIADVRQMLESVSVTAQTIDGVADRQTYYDNVMIMAMSGASLVEIGSYLEQVQTAAVGSGSVVDVLQGAFVGRFLVMDQLPPRDFMDQLPLRSFIDNPRGHA